MSGTNIPQPDFDGARGMYVRPPAPVNVVAKTADYTVTFEDCGHLFTNRGAAGAVVFTLPAVAAKYKGFWVDFMVVADQDVTIAGTAGQLVAFNDAAANSIAFSTATEKIGAYVRALCDGTSWLIQVGLGAETQTPTIAT